MRMPNSRVRDITAFREDLKQAASTEELEGLSGKKRKEKPDAIRDACQAWVQAPLRDGVSKRVAEFVAEAGRVELDVAPHSIRTAG